MSCSLDLFGSLWLVLLIKKKDRLVCYIFIHEKVYVKVFFMTPDPWTKLLDYSINNYGN